MNTLNLEPNAVFCYFEKLASIPHGSGNTKAISDYLVSFAKEHNFEYYQDAWNNVIMICPATVGYEEAEPIILQGHMDMVCEKEAGCTIDFAKDGLELYVDGDFLKARGTTLGGDDGIAVAYALALMTDETLKHPRLEAVITTEEEVGMDGAKGIDLSMLKGRRMLNIDSDVEGEFLTSCAGGVRVHATIPIKRTRMQGEKLSLLLTDLDGGHSGAEIDKEHGNADILMGRLFALLLQESPFGIINLAGGLKDNAIPRECRADILVPAENKADILRVCGEYEKILQKELLVPDPNVRLVVEELGDAEEEILDYASVIRLTYFLRTCPNGVIHMSRQMPGLVETSLNLGVMELTATELETHHAIRSSVSTRKRDVADRLEMLIEMIGGDYEESGEYPAWEYRPQSRLREQIAEVYEKVTGQAPRFTAIHAGLECGILSEKLPELDCVSFGPTNYDIHTPKERLSISSTRRYWDFLCAFLEQAKE